jgi:hypothetical protein
MNMEEYLAQENPVYKPKVELTWEDYQVLVTIPPQFEGDKEHHSIRIRALPQYRYILLGRSGYLRTDDGDGNPKGYSCFYIENLG